MVNKKQSHLMELGLNSLSPLRLSPLSTTMLKMFSLILEVENVQNHKNLHSVHYGLHQTMSAVYYHFG
jgi:hypothetical protein